MPGSSFSSRLRRWLGFGKVAPIERELDAVVGDPVPQPDPSETIRLGPVDEVKVDLGPDEGGAGLLERWDATSIGEPTVAPPAKETPAELPEVTIKAPRSAIPFDRTVPRTDPEPAPAREVTVTEVLSTSPFPWALVIAAIAMVVLALVLALVAGR